MHIFIIDAHSEQLECTHVLETYIPSSSNARKAVNPTMTAGTITDDQWKPAGYRAIRTAVSDNLVDWKQATNLTYVDSPEVQLYTNAVQVYHRAPHVLIGFPTRYIDRGPSATMQQLPDVKNRKLRASANARYGYALTDGLFMTSRDGVQCPQ